MHPGRSTALNEESKQRAEDSLQLELPCHGRGRRDRLRTSSRAVRRTRGRRGASRSIAVSCILVHTELSSSCVSLSAVHPGLSSPGPPSSSLLFAFQCRRVARPTLAEAYLGCRGNEMCRRCIQCTAALASDAPLFLLLSRCRSACVFAIPPIEAGWLAAGCTASCVDGTNQRENCVRG